jgi:hypothetical protein
MSDPARINIWAGLAMITDRSANIYEGAAGERILGSAKPV